MQGLRMLNPHFASPHKDRLDSLQTRSPSLCTHRRVQGPLRGGSRHGRFGSEPPGTAAFCRRLEESTTPGPAVHSPAPRCLSHRSPSALPLRNNNLVLPLSPSPAQNR